MAVDVARSRKTPLRVRIVEVRALVPGDFFELPTVNQKGVWGPGEDTPPPARRCMVCWQDRLDTWCVNPKDELFRIAAIRQVRHLPDVRNWEE